MNASDSSKRSDTFPVLGGASTEAPTAVPAEHSELMQYAYEQYCERIEAGEAVAPERFAARFPTIESSLLRQIEVHHYLESAVPPVPAASSLLGFQAGDCVVGFTLLREMGRGAFARVFLASDTRLAGRRVVVKLCERGQQEAQTIARLAHDNVVPILSVYSDKDLGVSVLCMPFLGGLTLQHLISATRGNVPGTNTIRSACELLGPDEGIPKKLPRLFERQFPRVVCSLACDVLAALEHVHAQGYCHGDIKPSNVLVAWDGVGRLLDFNLANAEGNGRTFLGGTLDYMAPEQLECLCRRRDPKDLPFDPRVDLFSLGATIYHVLTGRAPFGTRKREESPEEAAERLLKAPAPASILAINPDVDATLATAIEQCLARDPSRRPASAAALRARLRSVFSIRSRVQHAARRHPRVVRAAFSVLACAIIAIATFVATREPRETRLLAAAWEDVGRGDFDSAAENFEQVANLRPELREAKYGRAFANLAGERLSEAAKALNALESDDRRVAEARGYCLTLPGPQSNRKAAQRIYEDLLKEDPDNPILLNNAGYCCLELKQHDLAIEHLTRAVELSPRLQSAHRNLAVADWKLAGRRDRSPDTRHIAAALEVGPASPELLRDAAISYSLAAAYARKTGSSDAGILAAKAVEYCRQAVDHGLPPDEVSNITSVLPAGNDSAVMKSLSASSPHPAPPPTTFVENPGRRFLTELRQPHQGAPREATPRG